jgi:hypothetical protein
MRDINRAKYRKDILRFVFMACSIPNLPLIAMQIVIGQLRTTKNGTFRGSGAFAASKQEAT